MTALADIGKSMLAVARLKGSDLEEFNEAHPRDDAGRFARAGASGAKDPRMERKARRLRRTRRANRVAVHTAALDAAKAKEETSLASLLRPRMEKERPRRSDLNARNAKRSVQQKPAVKEKPKVDLDDDSYLKYEGRQGVRRMESVVFITAEQAEEFQQNRQLIVGAANDRWGVKLTSQLLKDAVVPEGSDPSNLVALRFARPHFIDTSSAEAERASRLAPAQLIQPWLNPERYSGTTGALGFTNGVGEHVQIPIIDVQGWNADEVKAGFAVYKAAAWEAEAHPRDPRSGRFAEAGGGEKVDPRIARAQRRKRRQRRTAAMDIRVRSHEPSAAEREQAVAQRERPERERQSPPRSRRSDLNARKPRVGAAPAEEQPRPLKAVGWLRYGDVGAGGRIVSPQRAAGMQRHERISVDIPRKFAQPKARAATVVEPDETFVEVEAPEPKRRKLKDINKPQMTEAERAEMRERIWDTYIPL